jgi:Leucine-rich repeat (LRR) protein
MQSLIQYKTSDLVIIPSQTHYVHLTATARLNRGFTALETTVKTLGLAILFSSSLRTAWQQVLTGRVSISALPTDHPIHDKIKAARFFTTNSKDYISIISSFGERENLRLVNHAFQQAVDSSFFDLRKMYEKELKPFMKTDDQQLDDKTFVQTIYKRIIQSVKRWPGHASILQQTRCEHSSPYSLKRLIALNEWCQHSALIQFSQKIASVLPNLKAYLIEKNEFPVQEKAAGIRQWMKDNSTELLTIKHLDLSWSDLIALPKEVGLFKNLLTFNLSDNKIQDIPAELAQLSKLKELDLRNNQIQTISPGLAQLYQLNWLNLSHNEITEIPPELAHLSQLKWLELQNNKIQKIPSDLGKLSQLKWLDLGFNHIQKIPSDLGKLSQLKWLNLSHNQIQDIPYELGQLSPTNVSSLDCKLE